MRTVLLIFGLTVALTCVLKIVITPKYGIDVEGRFIERLKYIPSRTPTLLNRETLTEWLTAPENRTAIAGYVFPVLFPFDIMFLVCLGILLGLASIGLAERLPFLANIPNWIWWTFAALYMASDLAEDALAIAILKSFVSLTDYWYLALRWLTAIKLITISLAIGQVGLLAFISFVLLLFPNGRAAG